MNLHHSFTLKYYTKILRQTRQLILPHVKGQKKFLEVFVAKINSYLFSFQIWIKFVLKILKIVIIFTEFLIEQHILDTNAGKQLP